MKTMNGLPDQPQSDPSATPKPTAAQPQPSGAGLGNKEAEVGATPRAPEHSGLAEVGKDFVLPKEVVSQGVRIAPTQIPVPQTLVQAGVQPAGDNVTVGSGQTVTLPLTDDQIAQGLKQDVTTSWRWLAEWCLRKLKQLHMTLRGAKLPKASAH